MDTTAPQRELASGHETRELFKQLLTEQLIDGDQHASLTLISDDDARHGRQRVWHAAPTCVGAGEALATTLVPVKQLPATVGNVFAGLCACVTDLEHLAALGNWTTLERSAVNVWLSSEPLAHGNGNRTLRRNELAEFEAAVPASEGLESLTGDRGQRIRDLLAQRRTELEKHAAAEVAEEEARRSRAQERAARKESAPQMPWAALTAVFNAQVAAGVPADEAAMVISPAARTFLMVENGVQMREQLLDFMECGEESTGPEPMEESEAAVTFRELVDAAVAKADAEFEGEDTIGRRRRAMARHGYFF